MIRVGNNLSDSESQNDFEDDLTWHVEDDDPDYDCITCGDKLSSDDDLEVEENVDESNTSYEELVINEGVDCVMKPDDVEESCTVLKQQTPQLRALYACAVCDKKFVYIKSLEIHKNWHPLNKVYNCPRCPYRCFTYSRLQLHSRWHETNPNFQCTYCHAFFSKAKTCLDHEHLHSNRKRLCKHCDERFPDNFSLWLHVYNSHPLVQTFECGECPFKQERVRDLIGLESHADWHECVLIEFEKYKCHYCDYTHKKHLWKHIRKAHKDARDFHCGKCSQKFYTEVLLQKHLLRLHLKTKFYCEICSLYYISYSALNNHFRTVYHKVTLESRRELVE